MKVPAGSTFYDSASRQSPVDHLVAAYADGRYAYSAQAIAEHPGHILISVTGDPSAALYARCLDVEKFDATPDEVPGFVWTRLNHGHHDALIYVNRSNMAAVIKACKGDGLVLGESYHLWVATLDGTWSLPDMTGVAAIQGEHDPADRWDKSRTFIDMNFVEGHG